MKRLSSLRQHPLVWFLWCWIILYSCQFPANAAESLHQRKAKYVYQVMEYVRWPSAPRFTLCVLGPDPFGKTLDGAVRGKKVKGRPVVVKRIQSINAKSGCNIVYFSPKLGRSDIKKQLAGIPKGTLTVSDQKNFASAGGMIELVDEKRKIRFNINQTVAKKSQVRISSDLLKIAKNIY